jgi:hypothetical protein
MTITRRRDIAMSAEPAGPTTAVARTHPCHADCLSTSCHPSFSTGCHPQWHRLLAFVRRPEFQTLQNATIRNMGLCLSSGKRRDTPTVLGQLERTNLRKEKQIQFPKRRVLLCSSEHRTTDIVRKHAHDREDTSEPSGMRC